MLPETHRAAVLGCLVVGVVVVAQTGNSAQRPALVRIQPDGASELRVWDTYVTERERAGTLRARRVDRDPSFPSRTVERLEQYHEGVRIWGSEVVRDSERGVPRALFGHLTSELTLAVEPSISAGRAATEFLSQGLGDTAAVLGEPELVILPLDGEGHRLSWTALVSSPEGVSRVFVDALSGRTLLSFSEIQTQAAVRTGRGVLSDVKKLSVSGEAGTYFADDRHRPPSLVTYDFRYDTARALSVTFSGTPLFASDRAADSAEEWRDSAVVDAHVHIGWTYDYYFKRHGRRGLDNLDRRMVILTNSVSQQGALTAPPAVFAQFALNAFWCGGCGPGGVGVVHFGNGIPPNYYLVANGNNYTYFAGALDIAAHELTHGVTDSSSRLIYRNESGALNEAFSDIMGTSVEFFYHPPGTGPGRADYLLGEDISRAVAPGARDGDRSFENPALYGDPDHYSRRYTGTADNGGVHINSGIANHAFYLAIEGGTNRTSGVSVQGVGSANREQIERVFYRAFVFLMPASSTFSTARAATIQAARDLYGVGSAAERAVSQAWAAVGVS
jgi:thermolysin